MSRAKYPWPDMAVGDSFLVPWASHVLDDMGKQAKVVYACGRRWCARNRPWCTVAVRSTDDGVRVTMVLRPTP